MTRLESTTRTLVLLQGGMSVDHSTVVRPSGVPPVFLSAKSGDVVIVWDDPSLVGVNPLTGGWVRSSGSKGCQGSKGAHPVPSQRCRHRSDPMGQRRPGEADHAPV